MSFHLDARSTRFAVRHPARVPAHWRHRSCKTLLDPLVFSGLLSGTAVWKLSLVFESVQLICKCVAWDDAGGLAEKF